MEGTNDKESFEKIFIKGEHQTLLGHDLSNLKRLKVIFAASFLLICFSAIFLDILESRMSEPFVKWIDVNVEISSNFYSARINADSLMRLISKVEHKSKYGVKSVSKSHFLFRSFYDKSNSLVRFYGASIDTDDPILEQILERSITRSPKFKENDLSIIVSKRMSDSLGLSDGQSHVFINIHSDKIPIRIAAIVEDVPWAKDFLVTEKFVELAFSNSSLPFRDEDCKHIFIPDVLVQTVRKKFSNALFRKNELDFGDSRIPGRNYEFHINNKCVTDFEQIKKITSTFPQVIHEPALNPTLSTKFSDDPEIVIIGFDNLRNIEEFNDYLESKGYFVNLLKVQSLKTFQIISYIVYLLTALIVFVSAAVSSYFISSLLKGHFMLMKLNVGIYKAFGLSDVRLKEIYFQIVSNLVKSAFYKTVLLVPISFFLYFLISLLTDNNIGWHSIVIIIIAPTSIYLLLFLVKHSSIEKGLFYISESPGDLIYNRETASN